MQGEVSSFVNVLKKYAVKFILVNETLKKLEMRQNDLLSAEVERKQSQTAFIDRHNLCKCSNDACTWRVWENRFELIDKQSLSLDEHLQSLDATHGADKTRAGSF